MDSFGCLARAICWRPMTAGAKCQKSIAERKHSRAAGPFVMTDTFNYWPMLDHNEIIITYVIIYMQDGERTEQQTQNRTAHV